MNGVVINGLGANGPAEYYCVDNYAKPVPAEHWNVVGMERS